MEWTRLHLYREIYADSVCPKSLDPYLHSKLLYKLGQDLLDIQYEKILKQKGVGTVVWTPINQPRLRRMKGGR